MLIQQAPYKDISWLELQIFGNRFYCPGAKNNWLMEAENLGKTYKKKMPIFWWTHRWVHIKFISRELTSMFVAFYSILFLFFINAVSSGPTEYDAFLEKLESGGFIAFHIIAFLILIFHSVTWFNLAPKAMVVKIGKQRVPGVVVALSNYAGWVFISILIIWLVIK
jgi:fumarate reductase subunit C